MCIRQGRLRNRIRIALKDHTEWGQEYSKEHYP
jgi:hypothetical protein